MEIAFDLTPLVAAKLITYSFGTLIHLFLMVLILGQRRMRRFEWLLFALVSALFMWNSGNLLALNLTLAYGAPSASLARLARLIPFLGATLSIPLIVHVHLEYALPLPHSAGRIRLSRVPKRPLIALFYLPLIGVPWLVGRLLGHLRAEPLLALAPYTRPAIVWLVLALVVAALVNVRLWQVVEDPRLKLFHGWLGGIEAVLAGGFCWLYLVSPVLLAGLGGYTATFLMAAAVVPGALVAYSIFRYNLFDLRVQRNLMYSVAAIFALLIYLNFIRRLSGFLEERGILPSAVTEGLMIFLLVILLEPVKKWTNGVLERAFASEFARIQRLSTEIQEFANRSGDLDALSRFVEQRVPSVLGLERVSLGIGNVLGEVRGPSEPPSRVRVLPIRRADRGIGYLDVVPVGHELSGEQMAALQLLADQLSAAIELCQLIADKVRLERELAEKAKMAFLGEMAARIAHNVKNPLSSMKTVVQLLEEDPSASERVRQDCRLVVAEIDRLNANISQVLRFAKPARDTDQVVDLARVVNKILDLTRAEAERRGVRLELESPGGFCLVEGGEEAVSDIVSNLLVNALDAASPGASVGSLPRYEKAEGRPQRVTVKVSGDSKDPSAWLSVEDQGLGVPPEIKARMFQPFFTTRPGGTGLGLAIVARRVEEIGGAIECISPVMREGGTRFLVRFRAARVPESATRGRERA
ncbi:MAG TPA: ATP-binding protein [Terriglobia bacterium]|nr:ATP-binding protein [Terriglobia bacterium]